MSEIGSRTQRYSNSARSFNPSRRMIRGIEGRVNRYFTDHMLTMNSSFLISLIPRGSLSLIQDKNAAHTLPDIAMSAYAGSEHPQF